MIKTGLEPLQRAIITRLKTDPILSAMVNGIYDEVEQGAKLPYVTFGDDTANPYDTKTSYGEDATVTLHCFAPGPGKTLAKHILNVVLQSITATPLDIGTDFKVDGIRREFIEVYPDGSATHAVCRFRIYLVQK